MTQTKSSLHSTNKIGGIATLIVTPPSTTTMHRNRFAGQESDVEEEGGDLILCGFSQGDEKARSEIFSPRAHTAMHTHALVHIFCAFKCLMPGSGLHFLWFVVGV